jgi:hypothetical protein
MRNFIVVLFCLVSICCFGQDKTKEQVEILELPRSGQYEKAINCETPLLTIKRYPSNIRSRLIIKEDALFGWTKIMNNSDLSGVSFEGNLIFHQVTFQKESEFLNATFLKALQFINVKFNKDVLFSVSTFQGNSLFLNCVFSERVSFMGANGKGKILFTDSQMPNVLDFSMIDSLKVDFRGSLTDSLKNRELKIRTSFSGESINNLLKTSQELEKCIIILKGTNLSNVTLPYDSFWVDVTNYSYEEKTALYEKLIKKCKEEGMDESVIGWSTELKKIENLHNFPTIGHFLNWFQRIFWNYGFTKSLILVWILGVFLLFNLLNFFIYPQLINVYFNPKLGLKLIPKPLSQDAEAVIGILKKSPRTRIRYMLHYTGMIFFGIKLEHTDMSFKNLRWVFLLYFQFITGIILLGFALNFVISK